MSGHADQCVDRYCELAHKTIESLTQVCTPCIDDHQLTPEDNVTQGVLAPVAAQIVLKVLYLARMSRPDLLWSVNTLARMVTKWNQACDKRLHRLIAYLYWTKDWVQTCFVGDHPEACSLALFCDASFGARLPDLIMPFETT